MKDDPFAARTTGQFKANSIRGGIASLIAHGLVVGLQICSTAILARLLSPEDFGLQGMAVAVTGFLGLFRDAGLSVASVQRESLSADEASSLFWINAAVGVGLTLMTIAMAPLLVRFFRDPRLFAIAVVSSAAFLLNGLGVQHRALLNRAMRFATIARIDVLALFGSAVVGVSMAALGLGYWALVGMAVSNTLLATAAAWVVMPWLPGFPRRDTSVRSLLHMGGTVTLNSVVVHFAYNTEKILLGRVWGAEALGLYGRAFQLANLPIQQLTSSIGAVAFPMLSRIQGEGERLVRGFLKGYTLVISLTVPVIVACAVLAEEIVAVLLGPRWQGAASLLRLLVPTMLALSLINPLGWFLHATGRVGRSLRMAFAIAPVAIAGVLVGVRYGPPGVAAGYSAAMMILTVPLIVWARHKTGIGGAAYWEAVRAPLLSAMMAGVTVTLCKHAWGDHLGPLAGLVVGTTVIAAIYGWMLLLVMGQGRLYADLLREVWPRKGDAQIVGAVADRGTDRRIEDRLPTSACTRTGWRDE
jgi:PST family polysaccharide transporter